MVEPHTFLIIELSSRFAAMAQIEKPHKIVHRHQLLVIARVPAQQSKEVDNSFGQISRLAVTGRHLTRFRVVPFQREHRKAKTVTVALAELTVTFGLQQQRQVSKSRHRIFPAESTIQQNVQRSRRQPLLTANHMGNLHQMVVHNVCQMVSGQFVCRFIKNFIIKDR